MSQSQASNSLLRFWDTVKQMFLLSSVTPAMPDEKKPQPTEAEKKKQEQKQLHPL